MLYEVYISTLIKFFVSLLVLTRQINCDIVINYIWFICGPPHV